MNTDQLNHYKQKLAFETDAWDLHGALGRDEPVVVVDGRSAEAYAREHIPGAVNLPHREIGPASTASLDRSKLYVTAGAISAAGADGLASRIRSRRSCGNATCDDACVVDKVSGGYGD